VHVNHNKKGPFVDFFSVDFLFMQSPSNICASASLYFASFCFYDSMFITYNLV